MFKVLCTVLRVCPIVLAAVLGIANNASADELAADERTESTKIITLDEQDEDFNALSQVMPVLPEMDIKTKFQKTKSFKFIETSVKPVEQPSYQKRLEALTEKLSHKLPLYSANASDLKLDTSSSVPYQNQLYLPNPTTPKNQISETITQDTNKPKSPAPDKSKYNLFNPTPRELWREFSTDRPDRTETPFTVDAGRFTMEADLFIYTRDVNNSDGTDTKSFNYFVPNFKVGLTNNVDLQIIPEFYNVVRTKPKGGSTEERSGFGDITARMKVNFWGNDGGKTAFGMMPFVKFPTNQNNLGNNSIEGGIIFPLAISLSDKWDVGMQTEFDFNKNENDLGYNLGFVNTVSFGYEINSKWSSYFELFTEQRTENGSQFVATFDTGLKYLLTENI